MTLGQPVSNLGLGKPNKERAWPIVKFLLSMHYNRNFEFFFVTWPLVFLIFTFYSLCWFCKHLEEI